MTVFFAGLVKTAIGANWLILAAIFLRFLLKKAPRRITCLFGRLWRFGSCCLSLSKVR